MAVDAFETLILAIEPQLGERGAQNLRELRDALKALGADAQRTSQVLGAAMTNALDNAGRASERSGKSLKKIENALSNLALSSIRVQGPLGSLANALLNFGAGTATVIGIAAGIALIGKAFELLTKNIETAKKAADEARGKLRTAQEDALTSKLGDFGAAQRDVVDAERRIAKARADLQQLDNVADNLASRSRRAELSELAGAAVADRDRAKLARDRAQAEQTARNIELLQKFEEDTERANEKAAAQYAKLRDAADAFNAQLVDLANSASDTIVDDLTTAIERLRAKAAETAGTDIPALNAALKVLEGQLANAKATESLSGMRPEDIDTIEEAETILGNLRDLREQGVDVSAIELGINQRILDIMREQAEAQARIAAGQDDAAKAAEAERVAREAADKAARAAQEKMERQAELAVSIASGVLGIAEAFGLADAEAASLLKSAISIGAALPSALSGDPTAIIGAAVGFVGSVIGSLFGESPEDKARKEILQRNTEALERVRDGLEQFGVGLTGNQRAGAFSAAFQVSRQSGQQGIPLTGTAFARILAEAGLSLAEFLHVAESFGVTVDGSADSFIKLQQAIAESDFRAFADTFAGQIDAIDLRARLNNQSPLAVLQAQAAAAAKNSPALAGLGSLDLSTAAGRNAAQDILRAAFEKAAAGQLTAQELGNLTLEDLKTILAQIDAGIDGLTEAPEDLPENQSFTLSRSITEVTGQRIGSYLATANEWARRTTNAVELMAAIMAGGGGASTLVGGASAPSAAQIDRLLGDRARMASLRSGNTGVS